MVAYERQLADIILSPQSNAEKRQQLEALDPLEPPGLGPDPSVGMPGATAQLVSEDPSMSEQSIMAGSGDIGSGIDPQSVPDAPIQYPMPPPARPGDLPLPPPPQPPPPQINTGGTGGTGGTQAQLSQGEEYLQGAGQGEQPPPLPPPTVEQAEQTQINWKKPKQQAPDPFAFTPQPVRYSKVGTDTFQPLSRTTEPGAMLYERSTEERPLTIDLGSPDAPDYQDRVTELYARYPNGKVQEDGYFRATETVPVIREINPQLRLAEIQKEQTQTQQDVTEQKRIEQERQKVFEHFAGKYQDTKIQEANAEYERRAQERDAKLEQRAKEIENLFQSMKAETDIDPDRYWASKSTGNKIATVLASAFAGLVSGMKGGPNQILQRLDKEREADIKAQMENNRAKSKLKSEKLKGKLSAYDMAKQQGLADKEAAEFARVQSIEAATREAQRLIENAKNPEAKARGEQVLAALKEQQLRAQIDLANATKDNVRVTERFDPVRTVRTGGGTSLKARTKQLKDYNEYQEQVDRAKRQAGGEEGHPYYFEQYGGWASDLESAKKIRAADEGRLAAHAALDKLAESMNDPSARIPFTEANKLAKARYLNTREAIAKSSGGVITDSDREGAALRTPDPTAIFQGTPEAQMQAAREEVEQKHDATVKAYIMKHRPSIQLGR